jgi:type II secretory pathway pseudopilin PulG
MEPLGEPSPTPSNKPSNRNFIIAIGVIVVILVLAIVLLLLVAPGMMQQSRNNQLEAAAQINAANTATAMAATALALQNAATATPAITNTPILPTKTPLVVLATSTPGAGESALSADDQATVQALQTQMALAQGGGGNATSTPVATALPESGFADEVGLPGMVGLAAVLIAVVFLARKLRTSGH